MKKVILYMGLFLTLVIAFSHSVLAGQIHSLPGGKNYLSLDNLYVSNSSDVMTRDEVLVKLGTDYTFSYGQKFDSPVIEITIGLFNNDEQVDGFTINPNDYPQDVGHKYLGVETGDVSFFTFNTGAEVNYISIEIYNSDISQSDDLTGLQLEEGILPTSFELYVPGSMIDTTAPYFQSAGKIISYVDDPITTTEIKSSLAAFDVVDGDVSNNIILKSDAYTDNANILGIYSIVFEVSDSSGNLSETEVTVEVVDVLKPVFSGPTSIEIPYPSVETVDNIKALLSASDNYEGSISDKIILVSDDYSLNASLIGQYQMEFSVEDASANKTSHIIIISVVDKEAPTIEGDSSIHLGYDQSIRIESILEGLSVRDNYDLDIPLVVESNAYMGNQSMIGTYTIVFSATDSSNNKTTKTITITVTDKIGPAIYFDMSVIQIYSDRVMELPDFAHLLVKTKELDSGKNYLITVKLDTYRKHARKPGLYQLNLQFQDESGETYDKDFQIRVIDKKADGVFIGQAEIEVSFFEEYKSYFLYGSMALTLIGSNATWFLLYKKRRIH